MVNLHDVARRANVSKTLVSRVINNQRGVSEESRERILAAMQELNYVPNKLARALVLGKTFNIGVVVDSLCEPFFFQLFHGIEKEVERSNYHVMFCSGHNSPAIKEAYIDLFASGSTDGVIIYGSNREDTELLLRKSQSNFPIVVVENELTLGQVNNVIVANAPAPGAWWSIFPALDAGTSSTWRAPGSTWPPSSAAWAFCRLPRIWGCRGKYWNVAISAFPAAMMSSLPIWTGPGGAASPMPSISAVTCWPMAA